MKKQFALKSRGLFDPTSEKPFKVSRSGFELFLECPRVFTSITGSAYAVRLVPRFNINSLVDRVLKKEFGVHRVNGTAHPLMQQYRIDAIPYQHPKIGEWRQNFKGQSMTYGSIRLARSWSLTTRPRQKAGKSQSTQNGDKVTSGR
jgi:hypothetical protein